MQKRWDEPVTQVVFDSLISGAEDSDTARLLGAVCKESGAWLHALLVSSLVNLLDDNTLRISVGLRLRGDLCQEHICRCGKKVDSTSRNQLQL